MTINLSLRHAPDIPIEADIITPNNLAGLPLEKIRRLEVIQGNTRKELGVFFDIKGDSTESVEETEISIAGDLRRVKMIGKGMNGGHIIIKGDAGMHLGAEMIAGRIHVNGSVGAWAAAELKGGNIQIEGDAGDCLCAGYRGSTEGMTGGRVYVAGNAGREMASQMRKGFIAVKGDVGEMAAIRMQGGTIIVSGILGARVGAEASRGMILALGRMHSILPTYRLSGISEREFTGYYLRYLKEKRPDFVPFELNPNEKWIKFVGDFSEGDPREELYARYATNNHLVS